MKNGINDPVIEYVTIPALKLINTKLATPKLVTNINFLPHKFSFLVQTAHLCK